jgi:TetR/AcrR family transcriptional regulator
MKEKLTEEAIKESAKRLFFSQGKLNAKMQDIAAEAHVNRALLHYYFRDREKLFEVVLQEALEESFMKMFGILSQDQDFEVKVTKAVHHIVDCLAEYPFIESFIISEINKNPKGAVELPVIKNGNIFTKKFLKEISTYIKKNKLPFVRPEDFIVNMMALCAYPSSTRPIVRNILGYSEARYKLFVNRRKKILPALILMKY